LQNAAYSHLKSNGALNNIVGDYQGKYTYSTQLNKQIWDALANNNKIRYLITMILSEFLKKSELTEQKLITVQSFNAALKLQLIICKNINHVQE